MLSECPSTRETPHPNARLPERPTIPREIASVTHSMLSDMEPELRPWRSELKALRVQTVDCERKLREKRRARKNLLKGNCHEIFDCRNLTDACICRNRIGDRKFTAEIARRIAVRYVHRWRGALHRCLQEPLSNSRRGSLRRKLIGQAQALNFPCEQQRRRNSLAC